MSVREYLSVAERAAFWAEWQQLTGRCGWSGAVFAVSAL
jgi:hypothetical protein